MCYSGLVPGLDRKIFAQGINRQSSLRKPRAMASSWLAAPKATAGTWQLLLWQHPHARNASNAAAPYRVK